MPEILNSGKITVLGSGMQDPNLATRIGRKLRNTIDVWFGPDLPMSPSAPAGTPPRTLDYPVSYNINIQPRNMEPISFNQMRSLADSFDLVRLCIETRKDQVSRMPWAFRKKLRPGVKAVDSRGNGPFSGEDNQEQDPRLAQLTDFFPILTRTIPGSSGCVFCWKIYLSSMRPCLSPSSLRKASSGRPASGFMPLK